MSTTPTIEPGSYRHADHSRDFEPTRSYAELRDRCPVHHEADHDPPFFVLTRFADVVDALKHPEQWRNRDGPGVFYQEHGVLGTTDDPDHSRHRRVLRAAFLPAAIEQLGPRVRAIADGLIDEWIDAGEGYFVELFAAPFPALVIAELLGVEAEERDAFGRWSTFSVAALTGGDLDAYAQAKTALEDYVEEGIRLRDAARRADAPADDGPVAEDVAAAEDVVGTVIPDDVLSLLTVARRNGTISLEEARHLGYQLLVAGHETTTSLLGMMLYRLLERPALLAQLRADRSLLPPAIEEALRFDSPVHGLFRTNAEACSVHGTPIPERSKVQLLFASANRDPAQFPEPDEFRLDRERRELGRHVAFGWGIHHCIGAPLARLETRIAFDRIFDRLDGIELAGVAERNDSFVLHGLTKLPIRWTPR
jgi:cytochrome P450